MVFLYIGSPLPIIPYQFYNTWYRSVLGCFWSKLIRKQYFNLATHQFSMKKSSVFIWKVTIFNQKSTISLKNGDFQSKIVSFHRKNEHFRPKIYNLVKIWWFQIKNPKFSFENWPFSTENLQFDLKNGNFQSKIHSLILKMAIFDGKLTILFENGLFWSKNRLISIYGQELPLYGRYKTRLLCFVWKSVVVVSF